MWHRHPADRSEEGRRVSLIVYRLSLSVKRVPLSVGRGGRVCESRLQMAGHVVRPSRHP